MKIIIFIGVLIIVGIIFAADYINRNRPDLLSGEDNKEEFSIAPGKEIKAEFTREKIVGASEDKEDE